MTMGKEAQSLLYSNFFIILKVVEYLYYLKSLLSSVVERPSHTRNVTSSNLVAGNI